MKNTNTNFFLVIVSILLLTIVSSVIYQGASNLLAYKKSMQADLAVSLDNLHLFTREYLEREYNKYDVVELSDNSKLPSFRFYINESEVLSLNSDLPSSGKTQYVSAHMLIDNEFRSDVDFRYRGGLPLHWLYDKKSVRVRLPQYTTYKEEREFNLVNPSRIETVIDMISYDLSREHDLLTPDYFPARVFINNKYNGLHFFLSQIDESFLRKQGVMPGSIYSGDTLYSDNPFNEQGMNERTFPDSSGVSKFWKDERLWQKDASRNAKLEGDSRDIRLFIDIINNRTPIDFYSDFEQYFDKEKYYSYWAMDTITGSFHHDLYHNQKMYFDPYKGRFEPIQWDLRFWAVNVPIPMTPLMKNVSLNPIFEFEKDKKVYELWESYKPEKIVKMIENYSNSLRDELAMDPYRQHPFAGYENFLFDKTLPYSMNEFDNSVEDLKLIYTRRHEEVKKSLENSVVNFVQTKLTELTYELTISVSGNSPVYFESIDNNSELTKVKTTQLFRVDEKSIGGESRSRTADLLYPGRRLVENKNSERMKSLSVTIFGNEHLIPSFLNYKYRIKVSSENEFDFLTRFSFRNAITGTKISPKKVKKIMKSSETDSIHPWVLLKAAERKQETIVLKGKLEISKDKIFEKNTNVVILPGTEIHLAPDVSLIFYGNIKAIGTEQKPILFRRLSSENPWGSIVVQGTFATDSVFKFVDIKGGSITSQRLVDYPGQLNIHNVEKFTIEDCNIGENEIGDDALHVAYSNGEIRNCKFYNTAFDALDMDIVDVRVDNLHFVNIGNDAIDLMHSDVSMNELYVRNTGDKCVSIGENSRTKLTNSVLKGCKIGIAVKDLSRASVNNILLKNNLISGVTLYRKNPRFSKGGTIEGASLFGDKRILVKSDEYSDNLILDNEIKPIEVTDLMLLSLEAIGDNNGL